MATEVVVHIFVGCRYPSIYIQGEQGYKEGNQVGYNMIPVKTLSLLAYLHIYFIDINIYALGNKPWSSRCF
jgi:hypothetical protein